MCEVRVDFGHPSSDKSGLASVSVPNKKGMVYSSNEKLCFLFIHVYHFIYQNADSVLVK